MMNRFPQIIVLSFIAVFLFSCSKSAEIALDQLDDLSGEYIAYGDNYQARTILEMKNTDVYQIIQEGVESDIEGILIRQGDMLYGAMQDQQGVAVAIYRIETDQISGVWYAGEGDLLPEVISRQTVDEVKGLEIEPLTGIELQTLYEVNGEIEGSPYSSILYIEPYGEFTYDLLWEDAEGIQIGIGIAQNRTLTAAFFSEDYKFWGVIHYKIDEQGNLQGNWSSYGNWSIAEEIAEGIDSLEAFEDEPGEN